MRTRGTTRARLAWLLLLPLALSASALAQDAPAPPEAPEAREASEPEWDHHQGGDVSFAGRLVVKPGEVRHGELTSLGGSVLIEGTVEGEVTVIGGRLDLAGTVDGDVTLVASTSTLRDGAKVSGNVVNVAGSLRRGEAQIQGDVVDFGIGIPMPGLGWLGFLSSLVLYWTILELLLIFLTLLLLCALVPDRVHLIAEETPVRWPGALLAGIGGYAGLCIALFLLVVTIIGIPLAFLLWCVFFMFKTLALAGIFQLLGSRLGRTLGREMSLLGSVLLGFLPFALVRLTFSALGFPVSVLGWFAIWMPLQIVAVGLMMLTRGGGRRLVAPAPVVVPPPPSPTPTPDPAAGP